MVRAVIDTNVLVSALIHDGKPRKLILELLNRHTVILSRQILAELADVDRCLTLKPLAVRVPAELEKEISEITKKEKLEQSNSCPKPSRNRHYRMEKTNRHRAFRKVKQLSPKQQTLQSSLFGNSQI